MASSGEEEYNPRQVIEKLANFCTGGKDGEERQREEQLKLWDSMICLKKFDDSQLGQLPKLVENFGWVVELPDGMGMQTSGYQELALRKIEDEEGRRANERGGNKLGKGKVAAHRNYKLQHHYKRW